MLFSMSVLHASIEAQAYVARAHEARRRNGTLQLAVLLAPETTPAGEVMVFPAATGDEVELAYAVGAQHQRQRVATRAVLAALELARTRGARRASLTIAEGNAGSAGVARATGFTQTDAPVQERRRKGFVLQMRTWVRDL
jgi:RimJ/RimL family protein N-acetyltransferase